MGVWEGMSDILDALIYIECKLVLSGREVQYLEDNLYSPSLTAQRFLPQEGDLAMDSLLVP